MPVKKDALGQHSVEMEWLVPGTPEQVWAALATGPGISAWFAQAEVEPRVGGKLRFVFGEQGTSAGIVTGWEPPRRFAYEERDWSDNAPPVVTEIAVTARSGGTCLVRMVHSLFASTDEWDDQLEGFEAGWQGFFETLRIYLAHFADQPAAPLRLSAACAAGEAEAWSRLVSALGLGGANVAERRTSPAAALPLAGVVERIHQDRQSRGVHLRLDQPGPGAAAIGTYTYAGHVHAVICLYFYGNGAEERANRVRAEATPWLEQLMAAASA